MSVFLALEPDAAVRDHVMGWTRAAREAYAAKWLPAEKLHVTLVFLGNPDAARLERTTRAMEALGDTAPFSLHLQGAGTFVTARAPSVLWLGVGGALEALGALQARACAALDTPPTQVWHPHLTLGRAHTDGALQPLAEAWQAYRSPPFEVRHLVLFESTHHHFRPLHVVALRPSPEAGPR